MPSRRPRRPGPRFFAADTVSVAPALVGAVLRRDGCGGRIVEVEAYTDDAASHYVTRPRTAAPLMGETHGRIYVYRIYGVHRCLNFTTDALGPGAVLIRALEPLEGVEVMRARRRGAALRDVARGPGRVFEALGLDESLGGAPVLDVFDIELPRERLPLAAGPRVGISRARDLPWRFHVAGSPFVSRAARR